MRLCVCVCMCVVGGYVVRTCVRPCVRACVRACVRVCGCECVCVGVGVGVCRYGVRGIQYYDFRLAILVTLVTSPREYCTGIVHTPANYHFNT